MKMTYDAVDLASIRDPLSRAITRCEFIAMGYSAHDPIFEVTYDCV